MKQSIFHLPEVRAHHHSHCYYPKLSHKTSSHQHPSREKRRLWSERSDVSDLAHDNMQSTSCRVIKPKCNGCAQLYQLLEEKHSLPADVTLRLWGLCSGTCRSRSAPLLTHTFLHRCRSSVCIWSRPHRTDRRADTVTDSLSFSSWTFILYLCRCPAASQLLIFFSSHIQTLRGENESLACCCCLYNAPDLKLLLNKTS